MSKYTSMYEPTTLLYRHIGTNSFSQEAQSKGRCADRARGELRSWAGDLVDEQEQDREAEPQRLDLNDVVDPTQMSII